MNPLDLNKTLTEVFSWDAARLAALVTGGIVGAFAYRWYTRQRAAQKKKEIEEATDKLAKVVAENESLSDKIEELKDEIAVWHVPTPQPEGSDPLPLEGADTPTRRTVRSTTNPQPKESGPNERRWLDYWRELSRQMRCIRPHGCDWRDEKLGDTNWCVGSLLRDSGKPAVIVYVQCDRKNYAATAFRELLLKRSAIESEFGQRLEWLDHFQTRRAIRLRLAEADPGNRSDWPRQHEWIKQTWEKLERVFLPRIKALKLDGVSSEKEAIA